MIFIKLAIRIGELMPERRKNKEKEAQVIKRVIFENDDGTIRYLEGEDVQKWEKAMSGLVTLGFVHGKQGQAELTSIEWRTAQSLRELEEKAP